MKLSDFDFNLPHDLIAKEPAQPRDAAKLLVLVIRNDAKDDHFYNLADYFIAGDVLVLNNSKVFPARLFGKREDGKVFEILLLEEKKKSHCLVKPGRLIKGETLLRFSDKLVGIVTKSVIPSEGRDLRDSSSHAPQNDNFIIKFNLSDDELKKEIKSIGEIPLPPYILKERGEKHSEEKDENEYQTVFAKEEGSVAAPTAGLHFTDELLKKLKSKGVMVTEVTLHVGLGTFEPIREEDFTKHKMHSEYFEISKETAETLNKAKEEDRRIIACGTTTTRVLESAYDDGFQPQNGSTNIFIYPGYEFKAIDGVITNFHLPKSSLLLLVSAFMGKEKILEAYQYAINKGYRFYSYGDGMILFK